MEPTSITRNLGVELEPRVRSFLNDRGFRLLRMAADRLGLSGRSFHRVLRVARTIADLEGSPQVRENHIAEAVGYRVLDRAALEE